MLVQFQVYPLPFKPEENNTMLTFIPHTYYTGMVLRVPETEFWTCFTLVKGSFFIPKRIEWIVIHWLCLAGLSLIMSYALGAKIETLNRKWTHSFKSFLTHRCGKHSSLFIKSVWCFRLNLLLFSHHMKNFWDLLFVFILHVNNNSLSLSIIAIFDTWPTGSVVKHRGKASAHARVFNNILRVNLYSMKAINLFISILCMNFWTI